LDLCAFAHVRGQSVFDQRHKRGSAFPNPARRDDKRYLRTTPCVARLQVTRSAFISIDERFNGSGIGRSNLPADSANGRGWIHRLPFLAILCASLWPTPVSVRSRFQASVSRQKREQARSLKTTDRTITGAATRDESLRVVRFVAAIPHFEIRVHRRPFAVQPFRSESH
jgi:hypothetical protein